MSKIWKDNRAEGGVTRLCSFCPCSIRVSSVAPQFRWVFLGCLGVLEILSLFVMRQGSSDSEDGRVEFIERQFRVFIAAVGGGDN